MKIFGVFVFWLLLLGVQAEYQKEPLPISEPESEAQPESEPEAVPEPMTESQPQPEPVNEPEPEFGGNSENYATEAAAVETTTKAENQCSCSEKECPTPMPCSPCPDPPPPVTCPPQPSCAVCRPCQLSDVADAQNNYQSPSSKYEDQFKARIRRASHTVVHLTNKCNDDNLRVLMLQSLTENIVTTKVTIAKRAAKELGGIYNVVCTNGVFSYYAAAKIFCEVTRGSTSCFAFRHDVIDQNQKGPQSSSGSNIDPLDPLGAPVQSDAAEPPAEIREEDKSIVHRPAPPPPAHHFITPFDEEERLWKASIKHSRREQAESRFRKADRLEEEDFDSDLIKPVVTEAPTTTPLAPVTIPDEEPVIDVHTQNLREETFRELLEENARKIVTNDGSTADNSS